MESSNNNGCEKSINLILNPKDNENFISIDDLKKRYRLSDEITKNLIEKKNSNLKNKISEPNKEMNNKLNNVSFKGLNNKDSLIQLSLNNKNKDDRELTIKNTKNESNQFINRFSNQELILPTCLTTKSISILTTTDISNVSLNIFISVNRVDCT